MFGGAVLVLRVRVCVCVFVCVVGWLFLTLRCRLREPPVVSSSITNCRVLRIDSLRGQYRLVEGVESL